ncbi:hypothetical protein CaCOL14_009762 [Colletotrichum acutatum]|uniref:Uncharacterized protein n=1 Tax=Glomerella acutata TaxID=27357 RepID=A0AAD8XPQ6_GLOAC|nr:uncharacterized protein BDZ83DRAFT_243490 [Colletotrichum acutatum]KAK1731236.1 hypothetical protein BDZ83DRAFT_243490 [Colletotrichum acutatum]
MEISTEIRQLATNLIDLELDNIRARAKYLDRSTYDTGSIGVHVYNDVGGQYFLPYDTSSPLPRETSYLYEPLSARGHSLQRKVRSLSHDGLMALYECVSQEIDELDEANETEKIVEAAETDEIDETNETDKTKEADDTDDQARSDDIIEGLIPLSEPDGLGNDKRASHLALRKKIQEVSRVKMFRLSTSSLIDSDSIDVVLIYLDSNGNSILQKSSWPVWTDFEAFIKTMSVYHHEVTIKRGGSVENIKQTFLQKIDDFSQSKPGPPRIAIARTYQTWFNNLGTMNDAWGYVTVDAQQSVDIAAN